MSTATLYGQSSSVKNDADFVIGIEGNFGYNKMNDKQSGRGDVYSYGLNFSLPINKFSFGIGILQSSYGSEVIDEYSGESFLDENGDDLRELFIFKKKEFELNYVTLANRVQYRFPCNCIFLHAGVNVDFAKSTSGKETNEYLREFKSLDSEENIKLKNRNIGFDFGLGFKIHINKTSRIVMRQTYNIRNEFIQSNRKVNEGQLNYLEISIGLQKGIVLN